MAKEHREIKRERKRKRKKKRKKKIPTCISVPPTPLNHIHDLVNTLVMNTPSILMLEDNMIVHQYCKISSVFLFVFFVVFLFLNQSGRAESQGSKT